MIALKLEPPRTGAPEMRYFCKSCRKHHEGAPGRVMVKSGRRYCNVPAWKSTSYLCPTCQAADLKFSEESRARYEREQAELLASINPKRSKCQWCNGTGKADSEGCNACNGSGRAG